MRSQEKIIRLLGGFLVATGGGLLVGYLVALGAMGSYAHVKWPVLAGFLLGMLSSLMAPNRPVLAAFCGGSVAVVTAVLKIVLVQFQSGYWPINDEFTIAMYGTATQATMRIAIILGISIVIPCLLATDLIAIAKRLCTRTDRPRKLPEH